MDIQEAYQHVKTRFPLPTEEHVADLESRLGVAMPPTYRDFLLTFNGGTFRNLKIVGDGQQVSPKEDKLDALYGIGAKQFFKCYELGDDVDLFDDNDPPIILPIGYTAAGSLIYTVTDITAETYGNILAKRAYVDGGSYWIADDIFEFFCTLVFHADL